MKYYAILLTVLFSGCHDQSDIWITSRYSDRAQAVASGEFSAGWLAQEIPDDAILIEQTHNIDTNQFWVKFVSSKEGIYGFTSSCTPKAHEKHKEEGERAITWWENGVREASSNILELRCNGYEHGPVKVNLDVIIDKTSSEVWYSRAYP